MIELSLNQWLDLVKELDPSLSEVPTYDASIRAMKMLGATDFDLPFGSIPWVTFKFDDHARELFARMKYL
jgi:hypothetical protein